MTDHVLGYRRLRDLDPELEQLAVNSRRSPEWVGGRDLADQRPNLRRYRWTPATVTSTLPGPVQPETLPVPSNDCLGLYHGQATGPVLPEPGQQHPEESVALSQAGTLDRALQDCDLLPKGEILKGQFSVACQGGDQGSERRRDHEGYRGLDRV